jgi:hypothetical protein
MTILLSNLLAVMVTNTKCHTSSVIVVIPFMVAATALFSLSLLMEINVGSDMVPICPKRLHLPTSLILNPNL